jgi:hypothetical protein
MIQRPRTRSLARRALRRLLRPVVGRRARQLVGETRALRDELDVVEEKVDQLTALVRDLEQVVREGGR